MKMSQRGVLGARWCPIEVPMQLGAILLILAPLPHYRSGVPLVARVLGGKAVFILT